MEKYWNTLPFEKMIVKLFKRSDDGFQVPSLRPKLESLRENSDGNLDEGP